MILGFDPGLSGAAVVIDTISPQVVHVFDMPTYEVKRSKKQNVLDVYQLAAMVRSVAPTITFAVIENVHSMPGQGVSSSFKFGHCAGAIAGICAAMELRMEFVSPAKWKRDLNVPKDKDSTRQIASQIFPKDAEWWRLKKHDGRAEAALIAYWGSKHGVQAK